MEAQSHSVGSPAHGVEPMLMTIEDLQAAIRCGKTTAFALIKRGEIEAVQVGRRRMPVVESVKAYVGRLREQAKAPIAA